jgi:hypothetical protein
MSKAKAHVRYKLADGTRVPGVTTITGELGWNTRVLINWANRIGLEGIEASKYTDDKADIGTLAHLMITNKLQGIKTSTDDYSKNQIKAAKNSVKSFEAWTKGKKIEPIIIEKQLVSEVHKFGGTLDILAKIDKIIELLDLKTGSGIYDEHLVQVGGGYTILVEEHEYSFQKVRILNIPRTNSERFYEEENINIPACRKIFLNCLANYNLKKQIKNDNGKEDFAEFCRKVSDKKWQTK